VFTFFAGRARLDNEGNVYIDRGMDDPACVGNLQGFHQEWPAWLGPEPEWYARALRRLSREFAEWIQESRAERALLE
jgi:hypothetical protein